jgi:hypothetical protein
MTLVRTLLVALTGLVAAGVWMAHGQDRSLTIGGPVLGFVPEAAGGQIRPILGIPGASLLGDILDLDREVYGAVVSPRQDYILALEVEDGQAVLIGIENPASVSVLEGVAPGAELVAISPSGTAAAFYYGGSKSLQLIRGLPEAPERTLDLDAGIFPGTAEHLAVSDDGVVAALLVSNAFGPSLWVVDSSGVWRSQPVTAPAAAAFLPDRQDVIVNDGATGEVFLLAEPTRGPTRIPILGSSRELRSVTALAASEDSQHAFITNDQPASVTVVDIRARTAETLTCRCSPTGLHPLLGSGLFRLNDLEEDALSVLDVSSEEPQIFLVPPIR